MFIEKSLSSGKGFKILGKVLTQRKSGKGFKFPGKVIQWQFQSWKWGGKERERKAFSPSQLKVFKKKKTIFQGYYIIYNHIYYRMKTL